MSLTRQDILGAGCAAAVLGGMWRSRSANFTGDGENGGAGAYAFTLIASVAVGGGPLRVGDSDGSSNPRAPE